MQVLPRGFFYFEDAEGKEIKGRFSTWAMNRFCARTGIKNLQEMFEALTSGVSIQAIGEFLLSAVEYNYKGGQKCPYTIDEALDWVDDLGGLSVATSLIAEAISIGTVKEEAGEEKKTVS